MLVICEDCAKKYNIDENRIKGRRARFTCNECGHIIIIDKADIGRPLINKHQEQDFTSASTIDLLREMEVPISTDVEQETPAPYSPAETETRATDAEQDIAAPTATKSKATSIIAYFLLGSLFSFLIITGGILYLYSQFLAGLLSQQVALRADLIVQAFMVLGCGWIFVFLLLFCLARVVSRSLIRLTEDTNRIAMGESDRVIKVGGPKEVRELARVIVRLTKGAGETL